MQDREITKKLKGIAKLLFVLLPFIFVILTIESQAQSSGGGYSSAYLFRNVGARPVAMGGAYTAIVNEPSAIFYNPAGLGFFEDKPTVTSNFASLGFGRTNSSIAWGQEVYENIGVGVGINSLFSGKFTARDIRGNEIGEMGDYQTAVSFAGAYRIESTSMGITLKYLNSSLSGSGIGANGYSVDLGTKFNVLDLFSFGLAVNNINGMLFWNNRNEDAEAIPYQVRAGIAMEFGMNDEFYETRSTVTGESEMVYLPATRYVLVGMDAILTQFKVAPDLVLGVEAVPHEVIAFRGGISLYGDKLGTPQLFPMTVWGGGVSIRPPEGTIDLPFMMNIDYTISSEYLANPGISHHVSIMVLF